jgi:hypothetical protein
VVVHDEDRCLLGLDSASSHRRLAEPGLHIYRKMGINERPVLVDINPGCQATFAPLTRSRRRDLLFPRLFANKSR